MEFKDAKYLRKISEEAGLKTYVDAILLEAMKHAREGYTFCVCHLMEKECFLLDKSVELEIEKRGFKLERNTDTTFVLRW